MNKVSKFNELNCLEHALKLLFKVGEMYMYKVLIQRMLREKNYEGLYHLLERCRYKERYKQIVIDNPYLSKPTEFNAKICLAVALGYLTDLEELEMHELARIIKDESYQGVYKVLNNRIYNN